jgi:hypothetical protein
MIALANKHNPTKSLSRPGSLVVGKRVAVDRRDPFLHVGLRRAHPCGKHPKTDGKEIASPQMIDSRQSQKAAASKK